MRADAETVVDGLTAMAGRICSRETCSREVVSISNRRVDEQGQDGANPEKN